MPHTNHYAVGGNRIDLILDNGATSSLWWATKNEWLGLLDVAGLKAEALREHRKNRARGRLDGLKLLTIPDAC